MRRLARDADALLGRYFARVESLTALAKRLGVSASYLARAYRAATGRTLHRRVAQLRLAEALRRLAAGANDLTALALELGYSSHSHFTSEFKRHLGVPPSRFRLNTQI
jgi:AraC family transcriptional regulator